MSDDTGAARSVRLRGRWVVVILAASLAFNVFLLATVFGHRLRTPDHHSCGRGDGVREFVRANPELRVVAKELRRAKRDAILERRGPLRAAHARYVEALRAEPFQAQAFETAQADYIAARRAMRDLRQEWVRRFVDELTPAQRQGFAEHLAKRAECRAKYWDRRIKRSEGER